MNWSRYQIDIYDFVEHGTGSAIVESAAGSGKTSTLVEAARRLDEFTSAVALCFNTRIKDELVKQLPASIPALTFNSLGYRAWMAFTDKKQEVDKFKTAKIIREQAAYIDPGMQKGVKRLVDLAKMRGIVPTYVKTVTQPLEADTDENWERLISEYWVEFGERGDEGRAIELARRVLAESIRVGGERIDFNDQIYLPVVFGADFPQYDVIFVDEAQDVSGIQHEMVERSGAKARIIAFGDRNQSLYHFRGAGADAMGKMAQRFSARSFPLSICYRCSKAVVKKAQEYVPSIECAPDAVEGSVSNGAWSIDELRPTDVILCRNNAPLVNLTFKILRAGKPAKMLGRDIGNGLVDLVKKMKAKTNKELMEKLNKYVENQAPTLDPDQVLSLADRVETIFVFMENASTPEVVITRIESMFADEAGQYLLLSSVHKFKGMEAPRVFLLDFHLIGARAKNETDKQSERNIAYVGITRAKEHLRFVNS